MEVTNSVSDNIHRIIVKGLVRKESFSDLKRVLADKPAHTDNQLWIDCSHLHRFSVTDTSLHGFVSELIQMRNAGTQITLYSMDLPTQRLFSLLNLDTLFFKADSVEQVLPDREALMA